MWKIRQIFDGEYGCEERLPGEEPEYLVILENEEGLTKEIMAGDKFLTDNDLDEGDIWPKQ